MSVAFACVRTGMFTHCCWQGLFACCAQNSWITSMSSRCRNGKRWLNRTWWITLPPKMTSDHLETFGGNTANSILHSIFHCQFDFYRTAWYLIVQGTFAYPSSSEKSEWMTFYSFFSNCTIVIYSDGFSKHAQYMQVLRYV